LEREGLISLYRNVRKENLLGSGGGRTPSEYVKKRHVEENSTAVISGRRTKEFQKGGEGLLGLM